MYSSQDIITHIKSEFIVYYRPFSNFPYSGLLWDECIKTVSDSKLMNNIIFCNDVLGIPPVKVFLTANFNVPNFLTDEEKKSVGAFWGFVFKFALGYKNQKSISVRVKNVRSATYFFDGPESLSVINEG